MPGSGGAAPLARSRSKSAVKAGLSVSELKAEMTVDTAMVKANWRKNWPVMPLMKRAGHEHGAEYQADGDDRPGDLLHGFERRVRAE